MKDTTTGHSPYFKTERKDLWSILKYLAIFIGIGYILYLAYKEIKGSMQNK